MAWLSEEDEQLLIENDTKNSKYALLLAENKELKEKIDKLILHIDTSYCETCAERMGIFDHLKEGE